MTASIADQLDQMLKDDKTFSTRSGLRFMAELVRDAFNYIEDEKATNKSDNDRLQNLEKKVGELDKAWTTFIAKRAEEQNKAEEERRRWRWAFITPMIGLILTEIARIILGR